MQNIFNNRFINATALLLVGALVFTGCFSDLDTVPNDPDLVTSETFYDSPDSYKQVLAKIYAGLATTGQQGPAGKGDLGGIDEGFSSYLRMMWYTQELTTDEAVCGWADQTIADFHDLDWTASDGFLNGYYNRIFYQIGVCNEFLRQTSEEALDRRDTPEALRTEIAAFREEARFMRALSYYHALDAFRNVPFVTEEDQVGSFFPPQIQSADLYSYIETELLDIEGKIAPVRTNEYARADQGAVWALLANLYLNAEVLVGESRYNEALTYAKRIIDAGYTLEPEYGHLFTNDNNLSNEFIFPIAFDGINTKTWGGTTFLINGAIGGDISPSDYGVSESWGGFRTTPEFVDLFGGGNDGTIVPFNPDAGSYQSLFVSLEIEGNLVEIASNSLKSAFESNVFEGFQYLESGDKIRFKTILGAFGTILGDDNQDGVLETNGEFLTIAEDGLYKIVVNRNDDSYSIEKVEVKASGSGIDGGSVDLAWNSDTRRMEAVVQFLDGGLVFEVGDEILGDTDADGILDYDGSEISIFSTPGTIALDLAQPNYVYRLASTSFDRRAFFRTEGQQKEIDDIADYRDGYAYIKFTNRDRNGNLGKDMVHSDTDFPVYRLGEFYLLAAEAILRGADGSRTEAADYFNTVRSRAYQSTLANVSAEDLDLQMILDERARELAWEGKRRTDLVRFNQFTTDAYLWSWKGGVKEGQSVQEFRRIFPIPSQDLNNNTNLEQNEGY